MPRAAVRSGQSHPAGGHPHLDPRVAGKAAAEHFDPTAEDAYWRVQYTREVYVQPGMTYDDYAPAYRLGYEAHTHYPGGRFEDIEKDLSRDYEKTHGKSRLTWEHAKHAVRAAWERVKHPMHGKEHR